MKDLQKQLHDTEIKLELWRGLLHDEGKHPNEGTIEAVLQLENEQRLILKKIQRAKKLHTTEPANRTPSVAPQNTEGGSLIDGEALTVSFIGVLLVAALFRRRDTPTPPEPPTQLKLVHTEPEPKGIEMNIFGMSVTFFKSEKDFANS